MPESPPLPDAVDEVAPNAFSSPDSSVDTPEPDAVDVVDEAAGVARFCSIWEISPDSEACELPAAVPVA
jgi:hypothetical protein